MLIWRFVQAVAFLVTSVLFLYCVFEWGFEDRAHTWFERAVMLWIVTQVYGQSMSKAHENAPKV